MRFYSGKTSNVFAPESVIGFCLNTSPELLLALDSCLSCGEASDRHTEGRAGNVGETGLVEEFNRGRVTTVFTADTELDVGAGDTAELASHFYELTNAGLVDLSEGIVFVDLLVIV